MDILIINGHLHVGGVERTLVNLLQALDYSKHRVDLLLTEDLGEYLDQIPEQVHVVYYDLKPTYGSAASVFRHALKERNLKLAAQKLVLTLSAKLSRRFMKGFPLPKELRKTYDCAIAYRTGLALDLIAYRMKAKTKSVWWHHGEIYPPQQIPLWRKEFRKVDRIICVSKATRQMLQNCFPEYDNKLFVVPNIINSQKILGASKEFNPIRFKENATVLVSVSRLSHEKHVGDSVEVMRRLKSKGYDRLLWVLVGDGDEREKIEGKIAEYGLKDRFIIVGDVVNPYPFIRQADLFVHPSWMESQGISVLEAMALGKPCVVVSSEGTKEYVVDGYNALQADRSIDGLADRVEYAVRNLKSLDFTEGELQTIQSFSPETVIKTLFDLLREG